MYLLNGKKINIDAPYTDEDGRGIVNFRDPVERQRYGVVEVADPVYPDSDLFFWTENEDGSLNVTPKTQEQVLQVKLLKYEQALDAHLDSVAQKDRWRDRFTFVARAGYPNPWQTKAIAFGTWMDQCNTLAYAYMEALIAGTEQMKPVEDLIASLPEFVA